MCSAAVLCCLCVTACMTFFYDSMKYCKFQFFSVLFYTFSLCSFSEKISPHSLKRIFFQAADLSLRDIDLLRHLHLRLSFKKAQSNNVSLPLVEPLHGSLQRELFYPVFFFILFITDLIHNIQSISAVTVHRLLQTHRALYRVKGENNMLVRCAKCCNPLPGDAIVGYVTRGRGVSVHRADCQNMKDASIEPDRMIEVCWENAGNTAYDAEIHLNGYDRAGLVGDLSLMFAKLGIPLNAISARKCEDGFTVTISMTLSIQNTQQLDNVLKQLRKRSDVIEVYRVSQ